MWIKSDDGNSIFNTDKFADISVEPLNDDESDFCIIGYVDYTYDGSGDFTENGSNTAVIAVYNTQARALEVLDKIFYCLEAGHRTFSVPEE